MRTARPTSPLEPHPVHEVRVRPAQDADAWSLLARTDAGRRFFYRGRQRTIVGVGVAATLEADDAGALHEVWSRCRGSMRYEHEPGTPAHVDVPWMAGLPFDEGERALLVLPRHGVVLDVDGTYAFEVQAPPEPPPQRRAGPIANDWDAAPDFETWATQVRAALQAIREGTLEKVVLARRLVGRRDLDLPAVMKRLHRATPESTLFLFETRDDEAWFGATPELLVAKKGTRVRTAAIAGSRPRGRTQTEDETLGRSLLASSKDAWEHELVARFVREALIRRGRPWRAVAERRLLKLPNVQHIASEFEAEAGPSDDALGWAAELHPTPAVGGWPRAAARRLIRTIEGRARGWYAGAVGWIDHTGDGEFSVVLRTGHQTPQGLDLWAGCGIVTGSDPAEEWEESRAKLELLRNALEGP